MSHRRQPQSWDNRPNYTVEEWDETGNHFETLSGHGAVHLARRAFDKVVAGNPAKNIMLRQGARVVAKSPGFRDWHDLPPKV